MRKNVIVFLVIGMGVNLMFLPGCARKELHQKSKVEIKYANWEVLPSQVKMHKEVVDKFNKNNPEIHVDLEVVYGGPEKILVEMAGGIAPDVFYWGDTILPLLVKKKAVINLTPFIENDKTFNLAQYFPKLLERLRYEEGIYGLPLYFGTNALVYNKSLFDKEGLSYPNDDWTWDDFLNAAQKLTKRENEMTAQFGALMPSYYDTMNVIRTFGGDIFDFDNEVTSCILDSPETKAALQFLLDLQNRYKVVPTLGQLGKDKFQTGIQMFMTGRLGMFMAPSFVLGALKDIKDFEWDVAPIPRKEGRVRKISFSSGTLHISSQCKHPNEAWEFMKFACSEPGISILGEGRNCIPSIPKIAFSTFCTPPPENIRVFVDTLDYVVPVPKVTWIDEFYNYVIPQQMDLLFLGKQSLEDTIKKIVVEGNKYAERP